MTDVVFCVHAAKLSSTKVLITKHYFGIQDFAEALLIPFIQAKMIETLGCLKEARGELNNMVKRLNGVLHFCEAFRLIKVSRHRQKQ